MAIADNGHPQPPLLISSLAGVPKDMVAHAMNRFIPRFFSCFYCAFHFAANSANIVRSGESILPRNRPLPSPSSFKWDPAIVKILPPAPKSPKEEVLWLNAVHNRVNQRLSGSASDDPTAPKKPYPSSAVCPACWTKDDDGTAQLGKTSESREALFNFLVTHYRPNSWHTDNIPREMFMNIEWVSACDNFSRCEWIIHLSFKHPPNTKIYEWTIFLWFYGCADLCFVIAFTSWLFFFFRRIWMRLLICCDTYLLRVPLWLIAMSLAPLASHADVCCFYLHTRTTRTMNLILGQITPLKLFHGDLVSLFSFCDTWQATRSVYYGSGKFSTMFAARTGQDVIVIPVEGVTEGIFMDALRNSNISILCWPFAPVASGQVIDGVAESTYLRGAVASVIELWWHHEICLEA